MTNVTVYGAGGFDPDAEDGNILSVEEVEDAPLTPEQQRIAALEEALTVLAADIELHPSQRLIVE